MMMSNGNGRLSRFKVLGLLALGFCIGVSINQLGLVMEVLHVKVKLVNSGNYSSPQSTFQDLMQRLPHLNQSIGTREYVVPNIVHYFWFANQSAKMLFTDFMSVLSIHRSQNPDDIWFHCTSLPESSDFYWRQIWKFVPLTIIYHDQRTLKHDVQTDMKSLRDSAVVATLLKHGGIFVDWNVIVTRSLNPLRNYSTCVSKESDKLQTDVVLSRRNAAFLQLVNSSLGASMTTFNSAVSSLYKQQPNLLHLASVSDTMAHHSLSEKGPAWQSNYILRIPEDRQKYTDNSIRTGSDQLSTAMRYFYYGSTHELS